MSTDHGLSPRLLPACGVDLVPCGAVPPVRDDESGSELLHLELDKLRPHPHNARRHSEKDLVPLTKSISGLGFLNPIEVDKNFIIVAGHGRLAAARALGFTRVTVLRYKELDAMSPQGLAYLLANNNTSDNSENDPSREREIYMLIDSMTGGQFNLEFTGKDLKDIERLITASADIPDEAAGRLIVCPRCGHEFPRGGNG